jgi:hypothetical protein
MDVISKWSPSIVMMHENERTRGRKKIFIQDNLQNDTNNAKWKELQCSITWIFMFSIQCNITRFLSDCRYYLRHSYHTFLILFLLLLFCDCKYEREFQRFMFFLSLLRCFSVPFFFLANLHPKAALIIVFWLQVWLPLNQHQSFIFKEKLRGKHEKLTAR